MGDDVGLYFGALAPPLSEQLKGHPLSEKQVEVFEEDRKAIARVYTRGLLSEAEKKNAHKRLMKSIVFAIKLARKTVEG